MSRQSPRPAARGSAARAASFGRADVAPAVGPPVNAPADAAVDTAIDARRQGLAALAFIDAHFRLPGGLVADRVDAGEPTKGNAAAWGAGVMLSALNAAATLEPKRVGAARDYARALDAYQFPPKNGPPGYQPFPGNVPDELFFDDNAWLALALCDTYRLTGDAGDLKRATLAFDYVASGESDDLGGGVWWSSKRKTKNACSNAPAICAALALYELTGGRRYLDFARRTHAWMAKLQDADGLYFDNLARDGKIERTKWSYNTALMIRADVILARVERNPKYLEEAIHVADASEAKWFRAGDGALVDEAAFGHLLCEALLILDEATPRPASVGRVARALGHLATLTRDGGYPRRFDDRMPGEERVEVLAQASAARAQLMLADHEQRAATRPATTVDGEHGALRR